MSNLLLYAVVIIVAIITAMISHKALQENEPIVIKKQREQKELLDEEKDVPQTLQDELIKAKNKSINLIKLRLISITIAGCVTIFSLIKLILHM